MSDSHNQLVHPDLDLPSHLEMGQGDPLVEVYTVGHNHAQELSPGGSSTSSFESVGESSVYTSSGIP